MLKVWGRKNSSNVRKALWCVEELALPYSRVEKGPTKQREAVYTRGPGQRQMPTGRQKNAGRWARHYQAP